MRRPWLRAAIVALDLGLKLLLKRGALVAAYSQKKFDWLENERLFDVRVGVSDFTRLAAYSEDAMEITETLTSDQAEPHIIKLSSLGWSEAVAKLKEKCAFRQ